MKKVENLKDRANLKKVTEKSENYINDKIRNLENKEIQKFEIFKLDDSNIEIFKISNSRNPKNPEKSNPKRLKNLT